ncbi:MAG: 5'/3'-nucleotidase SurE [Firmicutes bacterium]|nr:5'/3'-nucleotidase SurE [Bacillota bacterium]
MDILVTNDDGIRSKGLIDLVKALSIVGNVYVVAPDRERSGTGHAVTMYRPLRVAEQSIPGAVAGFQVDGTPADCVKLGLGALLDHRPDLVVSGVNAGPNLGTDVLYSGTVSAAVEALIMGIPALAVSIADYSAEWLGLDAAVALAGRTAQDVQERGLPEDTLLNINLPRLPAAQIKGIRITRVGIRRYRDFVEKRTDPWGRTYYWLTGEAIDLEDGADSDTSAVREGFISVTPVRFQLTHETFRDELAEWYWK